MFDGVLDWAVPLKTQIAVAGRNRDLGEGGADRAGTVDVELLGAEAVCPRAIAAVDELGTEHVSVERGRDRPVRYVNHAVIELAEQAGHRYNLKGCVPKLREPSARAAKSASRPEAAVTVSHLPERQGGECAGCALSPWLARARSRVRLEDVGDRSAAEGRGADRLDGKRCVEDSLAPAPDDRMHNKPVLVDQTARDE